MAVFPNDVMLAVLKAKYGGNKHLADYLALWEADRGKGISTLDHATKYDTELTRIGGSEASKSVADKRYKFWTTVTSGNV